MAEIDILHVSVQMPESRAIFDIYSDENYWDRLVLSHNWSIKFVKRFLKNQTYKLACVGLLQLD